MVWEQNTDTTKPGTTTNCTAPPLALVISIRINAKVFMFVGRSSAWLPPVGNNEYLNPPLLSAHWGENKKKEKNRRRRWWMSSKVAKLCTSISFCGSLMICLRKNGAKTITIQIPEPQLFLFQSIMRTKIFPSLLQTACHDSSTL